MSAFDVLVKILRDKHLIGSDRYTRGGATCVCFTEAPLDVVQAGLRDLNGSERYSCYGIQIPKKHVFALGGRPVIYETEAEFRSLPESHRWRHVRFELGDVRTIDFTWEREWRIATDRLDFSDQEVAVVVPDADEAARLKDALEHDSFYDAWQWSTVLGDVAWMSFESSPWKTVVLKKG